jgi:hypothetical protein
MRDNHFVTEDPRMARDTYDERPARKGVSLAKGPVGLIGALSLALGVLGFIFGSQSFTMHPVSGDVTGGTFLGIAGNGWTWVLFAAGGLLLLLGSPTHWGAKSLALIVGLAAGAASVIAMVDGKDVFGIIAENGWTDLVLGAGAVALIVLSLLPRIGKRRGSAPAAGRRHEPADDGGERRFERQRGGRTHEPVGAGRDGSSTGSREA